MLNQPENEIQQPLTPKEQRKDLRTKPHACEQGIEELNDEQQKVITGSGPIKYVGRILRGAYKGAMRAALKL